VTLPIPDTLTGEIQIGFLWANFIQTTKFKGLYIDDIRITGTSDVNDENISTQISIFPNPTSDQFTIETPSDVNPTDAVMTIYDLFGRVVMVRKGLEIQRTQDISSLTSGIYIIELKENGRIFRSKLLITK
jgi:Secretion system C-terminal sorting domain